VRQIGTALEANSVEELTSALAELVDRSGVSADQIYSQEPIVIRLIEKTLSDKSIVYDIIIG
jgi:hypothetical protein